MLIFKQKTEKVIKIFIYLIITLLIFTFNSTSMCKFFLLKLVLDL